MIGEIFKLIVGDNTIRDTIEVFRPNAEKQDVRKAQFREKVLDQFSSEFQHNRTGFFDRFVDGLNRLPRPIMALGCIGLIASAMIDPLWFASRMEGLAAVPDQLWYLFGAIVAFFFGGRGQIKSQEFRKDIERSRAVVESIAARRAEEEADRQPSEGKDEISPTPVERKASSVPEEQEVETQVAEPPRQSFEIDVASVPDKLARTGNPVIDAWNERIMTKTKS